MDENKIVFYTTPGGNIEIEVLCRDENLWLTQKRMAELFDVQLPAISKHIKNIFESGELQEKEVVSTFEVTAADGKNYPTQLYNLDTIIAVGYRVNSKKATLFRVWATKVLKDFIIKGFALDSERLKTGKSLAKTTSMNYLKKSGKYEHPNVDFTRRLPTFMPNVLQITIQIQK